MTRVTTFRNTMSSALKQANAALTSGQSAEADRLLSALEIEAFQTRDVKTLRSVWPRLTQARKQRRQRAAAGRIDLHTHTTASDGQMSVEQLLCDHFRCGQILINDHNSIGALEEARRLVHDRDLYLDVFEGIEVICTHQRRAFEFMAIAPSLSDQFVALCREHRQRWDRACERFVEELAGRDDLFDDPLWQQVIADHSVGGPFKPVFAKFQLVRQQIASDAVAYDAYLRGEQTFDMGNLYADWGLATVGDPPQLAHRFYGSMRCYAMNKYRDELGDWFEYEPLARRFKDVGCLISHNHPNYWDDDFIGELPHPLQEQWIRQWAAQGVIEALEVWSPPFRSERVPHYWQKVCEECNLIPMAGTDCHSGGEQELGGTVGDHPEIPPRLYSNLTASAIVEAEKQTEPWPKLAAWRRVLEIDYANDAALNQINFSVAALA